MLCYFEGNRKLIVNMESLNQKQPDGQAQNSKPRISWSWWIVLIGLMIWNIITYFRAAPPQVEIPYSTFID